MSEPESCGGLNGSGEDNAGGEKGKMVAENVDTSDEETTDDQEGEPAAEEVDNTTTRRSTLDCLASLEAALPMKRGLSSHYDGRSKTFGNLSELSLDNAKDLGKREHAVNKRRRLLLAHEYRDKPFHPGGGDDGGSSSSSTMTHTSSMPLLPTLHHHPKNEEDEEEEEGKKKSSDSENQENYG
ncbi:uncharacterized protein LOC105164927 [Sesamum indicum]|uniref:Uncharacterized protein LOC105164927 n=1 Tax=Sesamum indicum TaxID=4182 RepID=A0A6I9TC11_SESIN|nr:uncharacterized protein LOC105164927 [Sesamum indicum]